MQGWIKIHRKLMQNPIFDSEKGLKIWLWCLLKANHEEKETYIGMQKVVVKPGQFIYGRDKASEQLKMSSSTVRNWMKVLEKDSYLDRKVTAKYSIISIKNWIDYQNMDSKVDNKVTAKKQQSNTNKNVKNDNNDKNINTYVSLFNSLFGTSYQSTRGRIDKLNLRLKVYSMDQILQATKNLAASDFHQGKNDRGWKASPDFLIRSDEKVDEWLNKKVETQAKPKRFIKLLNEED